jgi:hypothetical protein
VREPAAFEEQKGFVLSLYKGVTVAHSFVDSGGQTFDCIPIRQQSGLRGVSAEIAEPPIPPKRAEMDTERNLEPVRLPLRPGRRDRFGNDMNCPDGTVPIRRVTLEEVTRFETLADYHRKRGPRRHPGASGAVPADLSSNDQGQPHEYAYCAQQVANLGGHSTVNVWDPAIAANQIFSLSQQWYAATGNTGIQTAEVGWQVYPQLYGHSKPVLFTYWTADGYRSTGSYGTTGGHFVQVSAACPVGIALDDFSSTDGAQAEIELTYYLTGGKWWLFVNGADQQHAVGYYPVDLYQGGPMATAASSIEYGGETVGSGSYPPMGSGAFANAGYGKAAYQRNIYYFPVAGDPVDATLVPVQQWPSSYTIDVENSPAWGEYFYFGGPGGAASTAAPLVPRAPGDNVEASAIAAEVKPLLLPRRKDLGYLIVLLVIASLIAPFAVPLFRDSASTGPLSPWLVELGIVFLLLLSLGLSFKGYPFGVLVDARNRISLSRLQIVLWTLLFVATFLVLYVWNVGHASTSSSGLETALAFKVPSTIWLLMGISGASAVGAPLILSSKSDPGPAAPTPPVPQDPTKYLDGIVVKRRLGAKPQWSDVLLGDEAGNDDAIDISKLQQLMLSLVAIVAYAYAIGRCMTAAKSGVVSALPDMDGGFIALIAASHATYLGYKAVSHSN